MDLQLQEHCAIITGGASGIGKATAAAFLKEGACVALWDFSPDVDETARELAEAHGATAIGCRVNITDSAELDCALQQTLDTFGQVDHLVHAAAIGSGKFGFPFDNLTPDDWVRVLDVNIMGTTRLAHAVAPVLREQRSGTMVFIASVAGQIGSQTDPPYSAAKAANINFAQCLAKDLAPFGVRVNTVCPGMIQTPLNRGVWQAWANLQTEANHLSYEEWAGEKIKKIIPLGQWQTPDDIANMIVFLSSARAAQVTGQTIDVDGGFVMHW
jgi:NAD(P)-dependent dehydrogenase (short-subunit alcohol dehydrogenase family)